LRSKGRLDVAAAALAMGGGGHRSVSGFTVETATPDAADVVADVRRALAAAPLL
jgi:phosphoesterase RecJ-like protein